MLFRKIECKDGIASWKIDSAVERWLSRRADAGRFGKTVYVWFYRLFDHAYYEKGLPLIRRTIGLYRGELSEKEKKKYTVDMVYSLHRFGCMFDEYFMFDYEHLTAEGRDEFITDKLRHTYYEKLNRSENLELFNNKAKTYERFRRYYQRDVILLPEAGADRFFAFVREHPRFIVKPLKGTCGKDTAIYNAADFPDGRTLYDNLTGLGSLICEELIVQEPTMASLHPQSLNTVRIPTVVNRTGVHIFHPALRIGIGDSVVDNGGSGGIIAPVDPATGIVRMCGADELGHSYTYHPDTGCPIPGFRIPRWDELLSFVDELVTVVPENRYCGWDLALTEKGWVLVEGNARGQFIEQFATRCGVRRELEQLLADLPEQEQRIENGKI